MCFSCHRIENAILLDVVVLGQVCEMHGSSHKSRVFGLLPFSSQVNHGPFSPQTSQCPSCHAVSIVHLHRYLSLSLPRLMAPLISHDLNSPVSLLWAHQLRREHATIVAQLEETKELHPSASELKKLVTRTEKAEAASNKLRKEVAELKTAHQKTVKVVESWRRDLQVKEKAHTVSFADREEKEERFRLEIETLSELLKRQEGGLASVADEVRNIQNQAEEGNEATEQRLLQKEDEIIELRGLIRALDAKIGDAVTVIKDSVECAKTTGSFHSPGHCLDFDVNID